MKKLTFLLLIAVLAACLDANSPDYGKMKNLYDSDYTDDGYYRISHLCAEAAEGGEPIEFIWNSPKFKQNFELGEMMMQTLAYAFEKNANASSRLHLNLPGIEPDTFVSVAAAGKIGHLSINSSGISYHSKDVHLSYVKNGVRHYVTLINTLNLHEGSMYYQSNIFLVIDETAETGNAFYSGYAARMVPSLSFETVEKKTED